jgi:cytochrome P450 family 6
MVDYITCTVTEILRKYPVLPFLDRKCVRDYELPDPSGKGTVMIPAGVGVYIPVMAIQNDPKYYPEPEKFDPERFTEEKKKGRPNYTYFPFGEGPRVCIGKDKHLNHFVLYKSRLVKDMATGTTGAEMVRQQATKQ